MFQLSYSLYRHLSPSRRAQLFAVLMLMLAGALAEVITLGAVLPFLSLLINPELAENASWAAGLLEIASAFFGVSRLHAASIFFIFLAFLAALLRLTLTWASYKFIFGLGADLGALVFNKVLHQPYGYHVEKNSSETLAAVEKVGHFTAGVLAPLMQLVVASVMVVAIFGAMMWVSPYIALFSGAAFATVYVAISMWTKKRLLENSSVVAINSTRRIQYLQEGLGAIRDIALEQSQQVYVEQFSRVDRAVRNAQAVNITLASSPKYLVESIAIILVVGLSNWLVSGSGGIAEALPLLGAFALGGQRILPHIQNIYNGYASYRGALATSRETLAILNLPDRGVGKSEHKEDLFFRGNINTIEFVDVSFSYMNTGPVVLDGVNIKIGAGARIGILGRTGQGKSTLLDILMGLLLPAKGQIFVNNTLLDEGSTRFWQKRIAHVPQSIFLCDKSIAENIALGVFDKDIDRDRLQIAIELAQLTEFIEQLPQGSSTRVGERGVQLSGGQRQRIGIARALYKNAEILVLDEATSALDSETERLVIDAIYRLNPKMIIFMIAHRVSTLSQCNALYRVEGGKILPVSDVRLIEK